MKIQCPYCSGFGWRGKFEYGNSCNRCKSGKVQIGIVDFILLKLAKKLKTLLERYEAT